MIIGIDARLYGAAQGGLGRYLQELIHHLEKIDSNHTFVVFLRQENWEAYQPANPRFRKVLANIPWYGLKEQLFLKRLIQKAGVEIMHFPHWNVPLFYNAPFVVTIHDLLLLHYPTRKASTLSPLRYFIKNIAFRAVLKHAILAARHIVVPSNYTRQDVLDTFGVAPQKISTIYLAPHQTTSTTSAADIQRVRTRYSLTQPYVLYVGVSFPHKNLEFLLRSWKRLKERYHLPHQLVLSGKNNYFYSRLMHSAAARACPSLVYTDFVQDQDLPTLYAGATLFVTPSQYEGFGLPGLEAMQYGVPVASSNATCLPEILGSAALYFNPSDENECVDVLYRALLDNATREKLILEGKNQLLKYSWASCAKNTLEIYQDGV